MPSVPIPPRPELVVCDLAGTTVYDRGEVPAAFEEALREDGVAFDAAEVTAWRVTWAALLDAWVCGDDVPRGRPAPFMIFRAMERCGVEDVRRVAVVGDTRLDLEAAWNAGVARRIGVLTGAHDRATLAAAPSTHVIGTVAELPGLWAQAEV